MQQIPSWAANSSLFSQNISAVMESDGLLSCLKRRISCRYSEPDQSNQCSPIQLL